MDDLFPFKKEMHKLVLFIIDCFFVFSVEVDSMPLKLANTLVLFFKKALCNGSSDVSVVAGRFLEVEVSRENVVNEDDE